MVKLAGVAQLAEHNVANVVVVGSNPITRSFLLWQGDSSRHGITGDQPLYLEYLF